MEIFIVETGVAINTQANLSSFDTIVRIGNLMHIIGNTIQVFANIDTKKGIIMNATGSWVQVGGTIIIALAASYDSKKCLTG